MSVNRTVASTVFKLRHAWFDSREASISSSRATRGSATRVSRFGGATLLLDNPVPRRSWMMSRAKDAIPLSSGPRMGSPKRDRRY
jgi:hypothetical protein